jgi:DnaJ-class molecular chaperone
VSQSTNTLSLATAAQLLGVEISAGPEQLRAVYLQKVQQHPPDREPELFEQIRDAYEQMRNPDLRAAAVMRGPNPAAPLTDLLQGLNRTRAFVGGPLWVQLLKEKRA